MRYGLNRVENVERDSSFVSHGPRRSPALDGVGAKRLFESDTAPRSSPLRNVVTTFHASLLALAASLAKHAAKSEHTLGDEADEPARAEETCDRIAG
jgi:hypothetical protein